MAPPMATIQNHAALDAAWATLAQNALHGAAPAVTRTRLTDAGGADDVLAHVYRTQRECVVSHLSPELWERIAPHVRELMLASYINGGWDQIQQSNR